MNNIARPKLLVNTIAALKSGEKDPRVQKLNTVLGPRGIRVPEFLKKFDTEAENYIPGTEITVKLKILVDTKGKSLEYSMKLSKPSVAFLVKKFLNIDKLGKSPNDNKPFKTVDANIIWFIVKERQDKKMSEKRLASFIKTIYGSLKSHGIQIKS